MLWTKILSGISLELHNYKVIQTAKCICKKSFCKVTILGLMFYISHNTAKIAVEIGISVAGSPQF
jgi:hypothetical protein